jgi:hypothetical protein
MKKILCFITFLTVSSTAVFAQFGLKAGVNLSRISTDAGSFSANVDESLNNRTSFAFGAWARVGKTFYLQPEFIVASKGGEVVVNNNPIKATYTDIDIPVLIGVKAMPFVRINAGPVASFKIAEGKSFGEAIQNPNTKDTFKNANMGYQAGAGLTFGAIDIDVRYFGSFGNISSIDNIKQKSDGWQITAGFKLF